MAFKLTKSEIARKGDLQTEMADARGKLEDALRVYNAECAELRAPLEAALTAYNEQLEEVKGFVEDIANQADDEYSNKSERWQDGDKGQSARQWIDDWQGAEFEPVEITFPDDLEIPDEDIDHDGRLEGLAEEAEQ